MPWTIQLLVASHSPSAPGMCVSIMRSAVFPLRPEDSHLLMCLQTKIKPLNWSEGKQKPGKGHWCL